MAEAGTTADSQESYNEAETIARREAALKRAFATPHKPHSADKKGRRNGGKAASQ